MSNSESIENSFIDEEGDMVIQAGAVPGKSRDLRADHGGAEASAQHGRRFSETAETHPQGGSAANEGSSDGGAPFPTMRRVIIAACVLGLAIAIIYCIAFS